MSILVTGGAGFIGSHLVDSLVESNYDVIVVDSLASGVQNLNKNAKYLYLDISSPQNKNYLKEVISQNNIQTVFHFAALPNVQMSFDKLFLTHSNTLSSTVNLLEIIKDTSVSKVIFSSTSAVYGNGLHFPTPESDPVDLITPYAIQKFASEQYFKVFAKQNGVDVTCLRFFNVFGERMADNGPYSLVLSIFLKQKRDGQSLTITNDGEQRRDFIYVKDVVRAAIMAKDYRSENYFDIFNVGFGTNFSINQIADAVGGEKLYIGERTESKVTLANINKIQKALGWNPQTNILEWIQKQN